MKIRNFDEIGDFGRTENDILHDIFLVSLVMNIYAQVAGGA